MPIEEESDDEERPDYAKQALDAGNAAATGAGKLVTFIGAGKIVACLVLFGIAYMFLFVIPHSVAVNVSVTAADTGKGVPDAAVTATYQQFPFGSASARATDRGDGEYVFKNVPSNTDIAISVKVDGFDKASKTFPSKEGASASITAYKTTNLQISEAKISGNIGPSCTKAYSVTVTNTASPESFADETQVKLVDDGTLSGGDALANFVSSEVDTLSPGDSATLTFNLTSTFTEDNIGSPIAGTVRIYGTGAKSDVEIAQVDKPVLDISESNIRLHPGDTDQLNIRNHGKSRATGIHLDRDSSLSAFLAINGYQDGAVFSLEPDENKVFYVAASSAGVGVLSVAADCFPTYQIAVTSIK